MFQNWGFLLGEIWVLILLAALIGLIAGWIIWGRRQVTNIAGSSDEAATLKADLAKCKALHTEKDARLKALEAEIEDLRSAKVSAPVAPQMPATDPAPEPAPEPVAEDSKDFDGDGIIEGEDEGVKPEALSEARGGAPDDLKRIKGIGPKLEKLCFKLGFFHFDQIASWTADEVAWVDANLEGFKGRVTRDSWVDQAKLLAEGGETEFSKKVDKGDVY
ncbi:MAG: hypothetical protein AAF647_02560 [Pseudomonadota bacterium]